MPLVVKCPAQFADSPTGTNGSAGRVSSKCGAVTGAQTRTGARPPSTQFRAVGRNRLPKLAVAHQSCPRVRHPTDARGFLFRGAAMEIRKPVPALGVDAKAAALSVIFDHFGVTVTDHFDNALAGKAGFYVWTGDVWDEDAGRRARGRFFIPALFKAADLPPTIIKVTATPRKDKTFRTAAQAIASVRDYHAGLGKSVVAHVVCSKAESDCLSLAQQRRALERLSDETGLRWALWVFSGGKSIHAYFAHDRLLTPDDQIIDEIHQLLCVLLLGDTAIGDPGRIMRLPGYDGTERQQPVEHLDPDPAIRYPPELIRDELRRVARARGFVDVAAAYKVLQLAKRLDDEADHRGGEYGQEIRDQATLLRRTHAKPDRAELDIAQLILKTKSALIAATDLPSQSELRKVGETVFADLSAYANLPRNSRVVCPNCASGKSPKGFTNHEPGSVRPAIFCQRCRMYIRHLTANIQAEFDAVSAAMSIAGGDADAAQALVAEPLWGSQPVQDWGALIERIYESVLSQIAADRAAKMARRHVAADALDQEVVEAAGKACRIATLLVGQFRDHFGINPDHPLPNCGFTQPLSNAQTFELLAFLRRCGNLSCKRCGPALLARKAGAILHMRVVDAAEKPTGAALADRPLWTITMPNSALSKWADRFNQISRLQNSVAFESLKSNVTTIDSLKTQRPPSFSDGAGNAYVAIRHGQKTVVISTVEVPATQRSAGTAAVPDDTDKVKLVVDLLKAAYTVTQRSDGELNVHGHVTSSRGLKLDPDRLPRIATRSPWFRDLECIDDPAKLAAAWRAEGLKVRTAADADGTVRSAMTGPVPDATKRAELWALGAVHTPAEIAAAAEKAAVQRMVAELDGVAYDESDAPRLKVTPIGPRKVAAQTAAPAPWQGPTQEELMATLQEVLDSYGSG